jgi:hypothetical protein
MFQLIATSICFFNILSTTPMCFTNAQAPLIFDTKGECNKTVNNIIKVINEPLTNKDVGIVFNPLRQEKFLLDIFIATQVLHHS